MVILYLIMIILTNAKNYKWKIKKEPKEMQKEIRKGIVKKRICLISLNDPLLLQCCDSIRFSRYFYSSEC